MKGLAVYSALFVIFYMMSAFGGIARASDPWKAMQERYKDKEVSELSEGMEKRADPWARLRAVYLPFTEKMETDAVTDPASGQKVSGYLNRVLAPYRDIIDEAAGLFNVPREIISAVIMVESGGDPDAKAKTSTASGLMQTVAGTFDESRKGLLSQGVRIDDNPFDPRASIMAGTWYLDRMYKRCFKDQEDASYDRTDIASWKSPVEYYYAGPGNGGKGGEVVIIYSGGSRVVVDKAAYSAKVMRWARIMKM